MRLVLACYSLLLSGLTSCHSGNKDTVVRDLSYVADSVLQEGDLVFRRGSGLASRAVLAVDNYSVYSHVGIVVSAGEGWKVVHAVPGEPDFKGDRDRVKMESLSLFFTPERAIKGAVMRVTDPEAAASASRRAVGLFLSGIPFDHDYNANDTTKMYCTELIRTLFLREGIDLTGGKQSRIDMPGFNGSYILPGDIQHSPYVDMVYNF